MIEDASSGRSGADAERDATGGQGHSNWPTQLLSAASLIGYSVVLYLLSRTLDADGSARGQVEWWSTVASICAGLIYLIAMLRRDAPSGRRVLAWAVGAALAARVIVSSAPPMLESDFNRYLWDGAVTAHGIDPFAHAPSDVLAGQVDGPDAAALSTLSEHAGGVLASINHPQLTTIYPPLAQLAFAVASRIDPFGVAGWRCVLAAFDALTLVLLIWLLRSLSLPAGRALLYVSNPLLLRETYAGLHMDVLVLPFLVGALLVAVRTRWILAGALAVAGSAVKVWPVLLLPLLIAPLRRKWKSLAIAGVVLVTLALVLWLPAFGAIGTAQDGFGAYGAGWQNNDGFFRFGIWLCERVLERTGVATWHSQSVMRWISGGLLAAIVLWQARSCRGDPRELPGRVVVVVGALFLLSPTQFPWYWVWCLPLLAVSPSLPLLLYTALLPLYYVQDRIPAVHWIEHAPVWGLLAISAIRARHSGQRDRSNTPEVSRA